MCTYFSYIEWVLRIRLVNIYFFFHKIWAEYGALKGFGSWHFWGILFLLLLWFIYVTRRAVASRVIRVQRRYTVRIRPIRLVNFGWIFELFIELYRICTHFAYIEYVLRIHSVNISLIFIKYEPSTEHSKGLVHERFFWLIRGEKTWFSRISKNPPGTLETLGNTYLDLWKNTGPSRAKLSCDS